MRQIFLDTETTGLSPDYGHRVIEIGCIEMIDRQLTGRKFHCYINPQRSIDQGAVKVHGLTTEFLRDKPLFAEIVTDFIKFVDEAELIIHNAPFDIRFLNHELKLQDADYSMMDQYCGVIDSLAMARAKHPGQRNSLDALCKRYEIDNSSRDLHGALLDAQLLAQVYLHMSVGQSQLFAKNEKENEITNKNQRNRQVLKKEKLAVVQANSSELKEHASYLNNLQQESGCVWLDEDN